MRLKNVFLLLWLRTPCYLLCSSTSLSSRCRLRLCLHLSIVLLQIFAKLRECFVSVRYGVLERFVHLCVRLIESTGLENWIPTAIFTNTSSKRINNERNQSAYSASTWYVQQLRIAYPKSREPRAGTILPAVLPTNAIGLCPGPLL